MPLQPAKIVIMEFFKTTSQVSLICMVAFTTLIACSNYDNHNHPKIKIGEALFNHHCANCHGKDGTGKLADQTPANILTKKSHQDIVKYVTTSINSNRKMPVFATMPYSEATKIANHLLSLRKIYDATPNNQKKLRTLLIEP